MNVIVIGTDSRDRKVVPRSRLRLALPLGLLLLLLPAVLTAAAQSDSLPPAAAPAAADSLCLAADSAAADSGLAPGILGRPAAGDTLALSWGKDRLGGGLRWVWNIAAVLIVFALLIVFLQFLRRFSHQSIGSAGGQDGRFGVLQQYQLGPKRSVAVLKLLDRIYVVGITEAGMTLLSEIKDPQEVARIESLLPRSSAGPGQNFQELYDRLIRRMRGDRP